MDGDEVRNRVGTLLGELAEIMGVQSPQQGNTISQQSIGPIQRTPQSQLGPRQVSAITEARNLFAPYPRMLSPLSRFAGRSAGIRLSAVQRLLPIPHTPNRPNRPWTQRVFCLGGPDDNVTPKSVKMVQLKQLELGEEAITTHSLATSIEIETCIRAKFPKLGDIGFELMRSVSGGQGKQLLKVSSRDNIPGAEVLRAGRISLIYIRPFDSLLADQSAPACLITTEELTNESDSESLHIVEINNEPVNPIDTLEPVPGPSRALGSSENLEDDPLCMNRYRELLYDKHSGQQSIFVQRENFLESLFGVCKDPNFNFHKKPYVQFAGEPGADIGALTKEFFWQGLIALCNGRLNGKPLFEGDTDHKLPVCDAQLLRSGVFKIIGKFMAHSAVHCGIAFIGISESVSEYLYVRNVDTDTPLPMGTDDVPDLGVRAGLNKIKEFLQRSAPLTVDDLQVIQDLATASEFVDSVTFENGRLAHDHILYYNVIEKRARQLESLKNGFREAGLLDVLLERKYLVEGIFPRTKDLAYPADLLIRRIICNDPAHSHYSRVVEFIKQLETRNEGIQNLLSAWTGWPVFPESHLKLTIEPESEFIAQACFNELKIPSDFSEQELFQHLNLLVIHANIGFGAV